MGYLGRPMGDTNGHRRILSFLEGLSVPPGARLLDVPAGSGPVAEGARALGYDVVGLDLFPERGFRGVQADACGCFPFASGSFDVVVSMEGIEHFEDQATFVRECARMLKPGGTLVLTTPNILHLNARFSAFLTGQRLLKHGFINEVATLRSNEGGRLYHGHAFLIDAFRLRYLLRIAGLRLVDLKGTSLSPTSVGLAPFVPLIALGTRIATRSARKRLIKSGRERPDEELERELESVALNPALLFRKKLIVVAQATGDPVAGERAREDSAPAVTGAR